MRFIPGRTAAVAVLATCLLAACGRHVPEIEQASVTRIITTLSADEMEGRRAFTPAATKAAEFIHAEFASIGLDHFDGLHDYLQDFAVYSVSIDSQRVVLNGRAVPPERVAVFASGPMHWTAESEVTTIAIGPDDALMDLLAPVLMAPTGNALVLLDPAHRERFEAFRRYAARGSQTLGPGTGANAVIVLSTDTSAPMLEVDVTASTTETGRLANVVGVIPGRRTNEIVLFTAHYDHIGIVRPVDGDSIANGANDDASGTTAVIELARYFKALGRPERTLVFVAFAAEEMGGFGSRYFATKVDPASVAAMFNIEMIGKPAAEGSDRAWITGFDKSDFGAILAGAVDDSVFAFYGDPYPDQGLFDRSDNSVFARLGVPAHSISSTPIDVDQDYHHVTDEVETLDLEHMTHTIRAIARAAGPIVSGKATPTRIDPSSLR
ncbi:MAG: M20/M25/M40 family metallo-hydrolase [Gemmatimonadales bacterium]|nr:M20/M25/M40 family metallo-hydrolase [Gemmatimonadales bacterium]